MYFFFFFFVEKYVLFFFENKNQYFESRFIICFIGQIMQRIILLYEMKEHHIHTNQIALVNKTTGTRKE